MLPFQKFEANHPSPKLTGPEKLWTRGFNLAWTHIPGRASFWAKRNFRKALYWKVPSNPVTISLWHQHHSGWMTMKHVVSCHSVPAWCRCPHGVQFHHHKFPAVVAKALSILKLTKVADRCYTHWVWRATISTQQSERRLAFVRGAFWDWFMLMTWKCVVIFTSFVSVCARLSRYL